MIKLKIIEKNDFLYKLLSNDEREFIFTLVFHDIESEPKVGDYIYMSAKLVDKRYAGYSTMYDFGNLDNLTGKKNVSLNDSDIVKFVTEDKEIYLKRLYG